VRNNCGNESPASGSLEGNLLVENV